MIRYYVTDRSRGDVIGSVTRAVRGGVDMIQVREKDLSAKELLDMVCRIRDLTAGSGTRILVNDRIDVALAAGIDGVHLPASGVPPEKARPLVGLVGVSTHSVEEAIAAERARADFIVFGPVFESPGKTAVGLVRLAEVASSVKIPVLAIGGLTLKNSAEAVRAGAAGIAGIRLFQ